jgi:hypothetical protein
MNLSDGTGEECIMNYYQEVHMIMILLPWLNTLMCSDSQMLLQVGGSSIKLPVSFSEMPVSI